MDGQQFDAITRAVRAGLPRRVAIKALSAAALAGVASRTAGRDVRADGHQGDFCNDKTPCNSPLVCINTECDHCRKSGACHVGWCCKGYSCEHGVCVACASGKSSGVTSEGCRDTKKKDKKKKGKGH